VLPYSGLLVIAEKERHEAGSGRDALGQPSLCFCVFVVNDQLITNIWGLISML
jgi:hypothetical protein